MLECSGGDSPPRDDCFPSWGNPMSDENKPVPDSMNRRNSIRLTLRSSVKIECRKGTVGFGTNLVVEPVNLSETGVRLVLKTEFSTGQEVEIIFQGQGPPVKRVGKVRVSVPRTDGTFETGIDFDSNLSYSDYHNF